MTVYIVTDGEYSGYHIEAVFTNKEQAELYCATHECVDGRGSPEIEKWEVDNHKFESAVPVKKMWVAYVNAKTREIEAMHEHFTNRNENIVEKHVTGRLNLFYIVSVALGKNATRATAEKAVRDHLAQFLYEKSVKEDAP